jgi:hypothetical protein
MQQQQQQEQQHEPVCNGCFVANSADVDQQQRWSFACSFLNSL